MFKLKNASWSVLLVIFGVFMLVFFIWPVFSLISFGIGSSSESKFLSFLEILTKKRTLTVTFQTLLQAFSASALATIFGIPAAFLLYRVKFPGRRVLRAVLTIPFVLPTVVVAAAFMALFGPGGYLNFLGFDRSFTVLLLALTFFNVTVVMRIVGGFWENLDPKQTEAARALGASPIKAFVTVTLPNLRKPIASAAALTFLFCATSFGVVFILGGRQFANVETEIYRATMQLLDFETAAVLALIQILIVVLTLLVSSRINRSAETPAAVSDREIFFTFKQHGMILAVFLLIFVFLHFLPILALITRSLKNISGDWSTANYRMLFDPPDGSQLTNSIGNAVALSTIFALTATVLAIFFGLIASFYATRNFQSKTVIKAQKAVEFLALMPLGVSAVILGLGLLTTMHRPLGISLDLRSSAVLIPIAQTLIALPLVVRTLLPGLQRINIRLKETAAVLGASGWRIIFTVELPLIKNLILVAAGFAFAASLGEFGAAAFLVRSNDKTLPVVIAQLLTNQDPNNYGMGIAAAVLLGLITAAVMVAAESINFKNKAGFTPW